MCSAPPLERGLAAFIVATVTRSHAHRFLIGSYLGVGVLCALPLAGRLIAPAERCLPVCVVFGTAWLAVLDGAALRVAMMLPTQASANWVFKLTEPVDKRRVLSTAVTVIQGATAIPLAVTFGVASGANGGLGLGITVFAVVLSAGKALIELLTLTLRTVPYRVPARIDPASSGPLNHPPLIWSNPSSRIARSPMWHGGWPCVSGGSVFSQSFLDSYSRSRRPSRNTPRTRR